MDKDPPLTAWIYRRVEVVSKSENRYMMLLLLVTAFSVGTYLSAGETVTVPIFGLDQMDKTFIHLVLVLVGSLLLLGVFGAMEAASISLWDLEDHVHMRNLEGVAPVFSFLDALGYAGTVKGKPVTDLLEPRALWVLLYGGGAVLVPAWLTFLYVDSIVCLGPECRVQPELMVPASVAGLSLILSWIRLVPFVKVRLEMWKHGHIIEERD